MIEAVYINLGLVGINLVVLGLSLKLYTEILKDKAQDKRAGKDEG